MKGELMLVSLGNSPLNFADPSGYCFAGCLWQAPFKALGAAIRRTPILGNILTVAATAICTTARPWPGLRRCCGSAVASGGKCAPGALSGAVGSFITPLTRGLDSASRLVTNSVSGGLASVAGGGKFGNGAVTAAFGYLFNELMAKNEQAKAEIEKLRGTAKGKEIIELAEGDPKRWTVSIDNTVKCPAGSPGCTQPYAGDILINPTELQRYQSQATDGEWYTPSVTRALGHELGHVWAAIKNSPYWSSKIIIYGTMCQWTLKIP